MEESDMVDDEGVYIFYRMYCFTAFLPIDLTIC